MQHPDPSETVEHVDLTGDGRGVVDDHEVARGELVGQVGEPTVAEGVRPRHQQSYVVARGAARLGRAVGDVLARLREDRGRDLLQHRHRDTTSAGRAKSAAR